MQWDICALNLTTTRAEVSYKCVLCDFKFMELIKTDKTVVVRDAGLRSETPRTFMLSESHTCDLLGERKKQRLEDARKQPLEIFQWCLNGALVCYGHRNKTGCLGQQKLIFSLSGRLEVQGQGAGRVGFLCFASCHLFTRSSLRATASWLLSVPSSPLLRRTSVRLDPGPL